MMFEHVDVCSNIGSRDAEPRRWMVAKAATNRYVYTLPPILSHIFSLKASLVLNAKKLI